MSPTPVPLPPTNSLPLDFAVMPPRRDPRQLRALADDPACGWGKTPVATHSAEGWLSGTYLSAFLHHHNMPITKGALDRMNGLRLWQGKQTRVPAEFRSGTSKIGAGGILSLICAFNHGFQAPRQAQAQLLAFLGAPPAAKFGDATMEARQHYERCNAFRSVPHDVASPTFLDIFKDDRAPKAWHRVGSMTVTSISANGILRAWPGLMQPAWDSRNAPREAAAVWEACRGDVEELHRSIDCEGLGLSSLSSLCTTFRRRKVALEAGRGRHVHVEPIRSPLGSSLSPTDSVWVVPPSLTEPTWSPCGVIWVQT